MGDRRSVRFSVQSRVFHSYLVEHRGQLEYRPGMSKWEFVHHNRSVVRELELQMIKDYLRGVSVYEWNDAIDMVRECLYGVPVPEPGQGFVRRPTDQTRLF